MRNPVPFALLKRNEKQQQQNICIKKQKKKPDTYEVMMIKDTEWVFGKNTEFSNCMCVI